MSLDLQKASGYYKDEKPEDSVDQWRNVYAGAVTADNDGFGDFEAPSPPAMHDKTMAEPSPGLDNTMGPIQGQDSSRTDPKNPVLQERAPSSIDLEDDWGDFIDHPQGPSTERTTKIRIAEPHNGGISQWDEHVSLPTASSGWNDSRSNASNDMPANPLLAHGRVKRKDESVHSYAPSRPIPEIIPPSNIPPPSTLLLLIATMLQSLPVEIKSLLKAWKTPIDRSLDTNEEKIGMVRLRLSFTRAIARIIAGRKLRWKRDTRLAQSMKIGPAQAGKSGGMKLTGIDRMEGRKEDQDAAEVVRIWKQHVGSLRASIGSAKAHHAGLKLIVPEIAENMPVRTAKGSEGALTAPKCCVLCGLKREERVEKVDVSIEDSFGEWWTEHWGHYDCRRFWEKHESSLLQR